MRHLLLRGMLPTVLALTAVADEHAAIPTIPVSRGRPTSAAAVGMTEMQQSVTLLAEGQALFQRGEYPQAADAFYEVLADAELPAAAAAEARLHLGRIAEMEGDWPGARTWCAAVAEAPETPPMYRAEAQFHVGRLYMLAGDALAAPALVKVLEMPDATPEYLGKALHCLGRMALEEDDDAAAEQYLQGALAVWGLKPEDGAATRLLLGRLALRRQRGAAARDFYTLVLDINLNNPESTAAAHAAALFGRAEAWQADGRKREAESDWRTLAAMPAAPMHLRLAAQRRLDAAAETPRPAREADGLACDFSVWAEAYARQTDRICVAECGAFVLFADRSAARPGERWLDFFLDLRPAGQPSEALTVYAWLYDTHSGRRQAEIAVGADSEWGWLRADMRRHGPAPIRLRVELRAGRRLLGAVETTATASAPPAPLSGRIPVILDAPPGITALRDWPVSFGVPFAPGALWDLDALRLVNDAGVELSCQKEITGRWAEDGAIQWVRFDALASPPEGCRVEFSPSRAVPSMPVRLLDKKGTVTVDTGMARYVLGPGKSPVQEVFLLNGRRLAFCGPQSRGLYVVTQDGRLGQAARDNAMQIEARGPVAACVRFEGYYRDEAHGGAPLARHITRLEFFAGQAAARITHTLVLSADTRTTWFKEIGWELDASIAGSDRGAAVPRASFGVERANPDRVVVLPLASPGAAAYMLQASHYRIYGGTNHCLVMHESAEAAPAAVHTGAEMGDWAMLDGPAGGLMLACRESARQHPKEFEIRPDRVVLRLFSNRAGEELDFRADTLVRQWNLEAWYPPDQRERYRKLYARDPLEAIAAMDIQAAGWAKTHEILIAPLAPAQLPEALPAAAARLSHLLAFPVYAQAAPDWIYQSRTMGAVYPRHPDKYTAAEAMIESLWRSRLPGGSAADGWYGFVNYFHSPGSSVAAPDRDYILRRDLWLACVRDWHRDLRDFVEAATRAYLDHGLCHWQAPRKTPGLYNAGQAATLDMGAGGLPFYWGDRTACIAGGATDLLQFQWLYQIGGCRRGADAWRAFGEGLKACWRPAISTEELLNDRRQVSGGRVLMTLKVLAQAYACDWDPELRFLAHEVGRLVHNPAADTGLAKRRPRLECSGSYHMLNEDAGALLDAWEITGAPRYRAMARRLGDYVWNTGLGVLPNDSMSASLGRLGVFFYDETRRSDIAAALDFQMRRACAQVDAAAGEIHPPDMFSAMAGMPMMMDVLERHLAAQTPTPAWLAFDACDQPCRIALRKPHGRPVDVGIQSATNGPTIGGRLTVWPLTGGRPGSDQVTVSEPQRGMARVHLPLAAPGVDYAIASALPGFHLVLADQPLPLVIYAPQGWRLPDLRPALPVYFRLLPESDPARQPRLLVEGGARFFDPAGLPWRGGAVLSGWVDLPGDRPGLWRLEPEHNRRVRAVNLPPFFALGRPEFYFEPDLPWDYQPLPDAGENAVSGSI